jgi:hypothetical protein
MPNQVFGFAPPDYGDWAKYAGFDRTTGEQTPYTAPTGVAPPQSVGDYTQQRFDEIQSKFGDLKSKVQKVMPSASNESAGFDFSSNPMILD